MTKTKVTESICNVCGIDVRDGSQFCYNCGSSVAALKDAVEVSQKNNGFEASDLTTKGSVQNAAEPQKVAVKSDESNSEARRRPKKRTIAPKEVAWVEPEGVGVRFLLTTILLALLTTTLLVLAFYFR